MTRGARLRRRGFTLIEAAAAMAAIGVIALVATMLFSLYGTLIKRARVQSQLVSRSRGALEYVLDEARRAGGNGVDPARSVIVEDNCAARGEFPACNGSDRITVIQPLGGYGKCTVDADLGGERVRVRKVRDGLLGPEECCLLQSAGFRRQVAFASAEGVVPAMLLEDTADCTFGYRPILGDVPDSLTGATIVMSDVKTFYVEYGARDRAGRLLMHTELDGNIASIRGERLPLATGILDLQADPSGTLLTVSVLLGLQHPDGRTEGSTALRPAPRTFGVPYLLDEATARVSLRNMR